MIKRVVAITQESPKVRITVECADDNSAERVDALGDSLLQKINLAAQGYHQPDIPELKDEDRKGKP